MAINLSPRHSLVATLALIFVLYIAFQARFLILGPRVWIDAPHNGAATTSPVVTISGRAENAAWISLNGAQIYTDKKGFWEEKLPLAPGASIMTVRVRDRFGRESEEQITIILNQQ